MRKKCTEYARVRARQSIRKMRKIERLFMTISWSKIVKLEGKKFQSFIELGAHEWSTWSHCIVVSMINAGSGH